MKINLMFKKLWDWALNHFFKTFIILLVVNVLFFISSQNVPWIVTGLSFVLLVAYVIFFMVTRIKYQLYKLLHHELGFKEIISGYVTSVMFIVLLFAILYSGSTLIGVGYLKYGSCIDNIKVSSALITSDPDIVKTFMHEVYFSAITFFSVGYGDICPMGATKLLAVLNAIIGNAFTVIILSIAITNYSANKLNDEENKNNEDVNTKESTSKEDINKNDNTNKENNKIKEDGKTIK
jgi:potassium channel LctB